MTWYPWPTDVETTLIHAEALVDAVAYVTHSSWIDGWTPWDT
jgi:hypothetical protein